MTDDAASRPEGRRPRRGCLLLGPVGPAGEPLAAWALAAGAGPRAAPAGDEVRLGVGRLRQRRGVRADVDLAVLRHRYRLAGPGLADQLAVVVDLAVAHLDGVDVGAARGRAGRRAAGGAFGAGQQPGRVGGRGARTGQPQGDRADDDDLANSHVYLTFLGGPLVEAGPGSRAVAEGTLNPAEVIF